MNFEETWRKIINHAGEEFYTKRHLAFRYKIINNYVVPDRTNYPLSKANFQKAAEFMPLEVPGQISNLVRGPSYVFAILTDKRIQ